MSLECCDLSDQQRSAGAFPDPAEEPVKPDQLQAIDAASAPSSYYVLECPDLSELRLTIFTSFTVAQHLLAGDKYTHHAVRPASAEDSDNPSVRSLVANLTPAQETAQSSRHPGLFPAHRLLPSLPVLLHKYRDPRRTSRDIQHRRRHRSRPDGLE